MEKLIELLNEYQYGMFVYENDLLLLRIGSNVKVGGETFVISKNFGFIKWLVENEKIDIKALVVKGEMRSGWDFENKKGNEESGEEIWNKYYSELCLMILAIQDEPINFLISILK